MTIDRKEILNLLRLIFYVEDVVINNINKIEIKDKNSDNSPNHLAILKKLKIISKYTNNTLTILVDDLMYISKESLIRFEIKLQEYEDIVIILRKKLDETNKSIKKLNEQKISCCLEKNNFELWPEPTHFFSKVKLNNAINFLDKQNFNLYVYRKKRYLDQHPKRFIQGAANDNFTQDRNRSFRGNSLQNQFYSLIEKIMMHSKKEKPLSIIRVGDGDLYFLNAIPNGSAKPGYRALRIEYHKKNNLNECRVGLFSNDIVSVELGSMQEGGVRLMILMDWIYKFFPMYWKSNLWRNNLFIKIYNRIYQLLAKLFSFALFRLIWYPILYLLRSRMRIKSNKIPILNPFQYSIEVIYALVSTRVIFRIYPNDIMLVGQSEKIDAIQKLMKHEIYKKYIGVESFTGYVGVEKIGAADEEMKILKKIEFECSVKNPKVILVGIGSAKLAMLHRIREFTNAVVVDVGAGIDALAGVVSQDRPYFADWINFKSHEIDYDSMDLMDQNNPARDSDKYKKIIL